jgi:hypothetical protein
VHFNVILFCIALVTLFFGILAMRFAGSEADNYFREGEPDYFRWLEAGDVFGFGPPPRKEDRAEIRRRITNRGRMFGATLVFLGAMALICSFLASST